MVIQLFRGTPLKIRTLISKYIFLNHLWIVELTHEREKEIYNSVHSPLGTACYRDIEVLLQSTNGNAGCGRPVMGSDGWCRVQGGFYHSEIHLGMLETY